MILPCIVCGKELEAVHPGNEDNQPYAGLTFVSMGHYGSTIFDPLDRLEYLEVNICDDCVVKASNQSRVILEADLHDGPIVGPKFER